MCEISRQEMINRAICKCVISAVKKEIAEDSNGYVFENSKISCTEFVEGLEYTILQLKNLPLDLDA